MKSFKVISKNVNYIPWANNIFSILLLKYENKLFQSIYKDNLFQSYNNFMAVMASLCLSDSHSGECIIKYFHFFSQEQARCGVEWERRIISIIQQKIWVIVLLKKIMLYKCIMLI